MAAIFAHTATRPHTGDVQCRQVCGVGCTVVALVGMAETVARCIYHPAQISGAGGGVVSLGKVLRSTRRTAGALSEATTRPRKSH